MSSIRSSAKRGTHGNPKEDRRQKRTQKKSAPKKISRKRVEPKPVEQKAAVKVEMMREEVGPAEVVVTATILPVNQKNKALSYSF